MTQRLFCDACLREIPDNLDIFYCERHCAPPAINMLPIQHLCQSCWEFLLRAKNPDNNPRVQEGAG